MSDKLLKCPLCDQLCDYQHIVDAHRDFWDSKLPNERLPTSVEQFNDRFGIIGLSIEEVIK